jgi:hypothetical protein
VLFQLDILANNAIASALSVVSKRFEIGMAENDVSGVSCTDVPETGVTEPDWYCNGDAWVKIFLEPIAPGKFKQFDYIYDVPGENEFPKERWNAKECRNGFHITRRKDVRYHLSLHDFKSAYIAEVVSMGDEFYDNPYQHKRKVRVVTFGPAVPLTEVLGKHPDDFKEREMMSWSAANNHIELIKLAVSGEARSRYAYGWALGLALKNGNDQIADFLFEKCVNEKERQEMICSAIRYGRVDLVKRLLENMPVNVTFFKRACASGQFEIFQLLCTKYGEAKCSDIILSAFEGGNVRILNYLKNRGVDMTDFEMFVYACTSYVSSVETIKYLVSEGADVKHPLIVYIVKNECNDDEYDDYDVCEFLLTQIDDKSEIPFLDENLDREIIRICDSFKKRIEAGEFD